MSIHTCVCVYITYMFVLYIYIYTDAIFLLVLSCIGIVSIVTICRRHRRRIISSHVGITQLLLLSSLQYITYYMNTQLCVYIYIYAYVNVYMRMHTYIHACRYTVVCVGIRVCMCVYMYF